MHMNLIDMFLLSVATGMAIRALFFPDAWEVAWKVMSEISKAFRDY